MVVEFIGGRREQCVLIVMRNIAKSAILMSFLYIVVV